MICSKCGRELVNNSCPYCNNVQQPVMINNNVNPTVNSNVQINNAVPMIDKQVNTTPTNEGKIGFFLKYIIITFILILFTILGTYLVTKKMIDSKYTDMNKEVHLNGYMYRLDKSLNTDVLNNRLLITKNSNYRLIISPSNISFEMYKDNLNYIKNLYIQRGYKINNPKSKTFNGVEYLTMEIFKDNHNELLSITRGNSDNNSYVMIIESDSNLTDYSILEELSPVIKNIKYNSISNRIIPSEDRLFAAQKVLIK